MLREIFAFTLASVLACAALQAFSQSNNSLSEELRLSQLCSKAAKDFRSQPEWADNQEPRTFTNHFNKKMGKCLVKVSSTNLVQQNKVVLETQHVYDALEGTVLGGKVMTKELPRGGEQKTLSVTMVRDGKILGKNFPDEAREASQWFETLMRD
jgi:hypothetical protein